MNSRNIDELISILEREIGIYEELLKISRDKTDVIVKGKTAELDNITKVEQTFVLDIGKLEALREKAVNHLVNDIGMNNTVSDITISELAKYLDNENAQRLENCKNNLLNIINEIKNVNDLNSKLIQNSIDYINFSINLLSSIPEANNNYSKSGNTNEGIQKTYFDVKL
ncbi:flagellar protein FlgN [Acetivibrio clariflavus]|uniref:FlgN protein n=1 Tax=Acetivibrio clariflavus (strain DSM 19732 / NBRC 101661 / EBR45) TaxID=720554 RepID=G8LTM5_ACECE|nr:flagellar protein FlgN [Acetivibrio clariflavus]AEV70535.1 FlgN protein [Acetivibrio clariflavus DSM 19732]